MVAGIYVAIADIAASGAGALNLVNIMANRIKVTSRPTAGLLSTIMSPPGMERPQNACPLLFGLTTLVVDLLWVRLTRALSWLASSVPTPLLGLGGNTLTTWTQLLSRIVPVLHLALFPPAD